MIESFLDNIVPVALGTLFGYWLCHRFEVRLFRERMEEHHLDELASARKGGYHSGYNAGRLDASYLEAERPADPDGGTR